jgi:hypothetical protein
MACVESATPSMFNRAKAAVQAFVRDKVGPQSALWRQVTELPRMKELKQGGQGYTLTAPAKSMPGIKGNWQALIVTRTGYGASARSTGSDEQRCACSRWRASRIIENGYRKPWTSGHPGTNGVATSSRDKKQ